MRAVIRPLVMSQMRRSRQHISHRRAGCRHGLFRLGRRRQRPAARPARTAYLMLLSPGTVIVQGVGPALFLAGLQLDVHIGLDAHGGRHRPPQQPRHRHVWRAAHAIAGLGVGDPEIIVADRVGEAGQVAGHLFLAGDAAQIGHAGAVELDHIGRHGAGMGQGEGRLQLHRFFAGADGHEVMVIDGRVDRLLAGVLQPVLDHQLRLARQQPHRLGVAVAIAGRIARDHLGEADAGFGGGGGALAGD